MSYFTLLATGQRYYYDAPSRKLIEVGRIRQTNTTSTSSGSRAPEVQRAAVSAADSWMSSALAARDDLWRELKTTWVKDFQDGREILDKEGFDSATVSSGFFTKAQGEFYKRYLDQTVEQHISMCNPGSTDPGDDFSLDQIDLSLDPIDHRGYRELRVTGEYTLRVASIEREEETVASVYRSFQKRR